LLPWLAGWQPSVDRTRFAAGLHAGSAVGLALALRHDVRTLTPAAVRRTVASAAPAALAGLLLHDAVERRLGRPGSTAALLGVAAAALWVADGQAESGNPGRSGAVTGRDIRAAALAQIPALAPGVSRTGATLTALRARGVGRDEAMRTSLLMSVPVTLGAAGLTAVRGREVPALVPTVLAGVGAYATARRVRASRGLIAACVAYRLGLAAAVAARLRRERP
jgi:undecaprenyl-diphosphatase